MANMNVATDEQAALLAIQIRSTAKTATIDNNPVAQYAHFCHQYNQPHNIVEGKAYEVPDLTSSGYKLYWSLWKWWTVGWWHICEGPDGVSDCCGGIHSESPCCLCETFFYLLCMLYPVALVGLTLASILLYLIAPESNYFRRKENYFTAFCVLLPTVIGYLVPVLCFGYTVSYMVKFTKLVERNLNLVPRNRVFSNMIYVRNLKWGNKHIEISGHLAAALRRNELSYDQIND
jgi:hypothetical protein